VSVCLSVCASVEHDYELCVCLCVCVSVEHDHELCARMTEAMEMQFGGLLEWTQRTVYSVEARINSGGRGVFFRGWEDFPVH